MNEKELLLDFLRAEWKDMMGTEEGFDEKIMSDILNEYPFALIKCPTVKLELCFKCHDLIKLKKGCENHEHNKIF